jgi:hypothetical protein
MIPSTLCSHAFATRSRSRWQYRCSSGGKARFAEVGPRTVFRFPDRILVMTTWAWAPQLSDRDDEESSEGGIDPLGTEPIAESLGVALSPGVRERQQHPRFVTAMAVST